MHPVPVEDDGRAVFPPVPLSTVLDEAREQVQEKLGLTLEANAAETLSAHLFLVGFWMTIPGIGLTNARDFCYA